MGIVARPKHATISGMISKRYPGCIVQFMLKRDWLMLTTISMGSVGG
jgi:hypothetical protein